MPNYTLTIEPKTAAAPATRPRREPPKGRRFGAELLAYVTADAYWEAGGAATETIRPVWLVVAQTEGAMVPFVRNLQDGQRALIGHSRDDLTWGGGSPEGYLELPKGRGEWKYRYLTLRLKGVAADVVHVVTAYLPPLVRLNPGMIDREAVRFLALTSRAWIALMLNPEAHPAFAGRAPEVPDAPTADPPWAYLLDTPGPRAAGEGTAPGEAAPPIAAWVAAPRAARARQWRQVVAHLEALGRLGPGRRGGPRTLARPDLAPLLPQAVHVLTMLDRYTASPLRLTFSFMLQAFLAGLERGIFTLAYPVQPARYRGHPADPGDGWTWARHDPGFTAFNAPAAGLAPPVGCRCAQADLDAFLDGELRQYFTVQERIAAAAPDLTEEPDLRPAAARRPAA